MCGICGIWDEPSPQGLPTRIERATRRAAHRGPDDEGFALLGRDGWISWGGAGSDRGPSPDDSLHVALGHRRLSIIDLSVAGHQPFASSDCRYWIVFNGEVYNHVELRTELEAQGVRFRTRTDTEVVLAAWCRWGAACLDRFNGMWAFAIFDREMEELFCSRDRFGVKPFCYIIEPGKFAFASETKQLWGELNGRGRVNTDTLVDFLFWGFQGHTLDTFIEGVKTLPGGHYLRLTRADLSRGVVEPVRFWRPSPDLSMGLADAAERFRLLLSDSVRLRLRSDVPVGITLSGGLDSSSIACLAGSLPAADRANPLRAFTVVYPDPAFSEERFARAVAEKAGLDLVLVQPGSGELKREWGSLIAALDEPFNGLSYYSNFKVYQRIREIGVPVILNGQGADELLLGYERYRVPFFLHLLREGRLGSLVAEVTKGRHNASMGLFRQLAYTLYFLLPGLRRHRRLQVVRPYLRRDFFMYGGGQSAHLEAGSVSRPWPEFFVKEFEHYQLPHLLHHEDAVSMHFSVEARNPFLDYRLFNLVIGQDIGHLFKNGWSKAILREAMKSTLPESVRLRRDKMGFDTPTQRFFRDNSQFFSDLLWRNGADPFLNVPRLAQDFPKGCVNEGFLCSVFSYLGWREQFGVSV